MNYLKTGRAAALLAAVLCYGTVTVNAQSRDIGDWKKEQLYNVEQLAERIHQADTSDIYILNTGPVEDIQYAIHIGPVENKKYLDKLELLLPALDKGREVIIYCGCCPLVVCPNLSPAYDLLSHNGFRVKVLALEQDLEEDWIGKKYPVK